MSTAEAGFFCALARAGINVETRASMYARCTAVLSMVPIPSDRANIVPITYGTVHARNPAFQPHYGAAAHHWGHSVSAPQLYATRAGAVLCAQPVRRRRADHVRVGAGVFRRSVVWLVPARMGCRYRASWRVDARYAPPDGGVIVDARRVLGRASSAVPGEHA